MIKVTIDEMMQIYKLDKDAVRYRIRTNKIKRVGKVEGRNIFLYDKADVDPVMKKNSSIQPCLNKILYPLKSKFDNDLARKYIVRVYVNS